MTEFVRFQSTAPNRRGTFPGVFALANGLARESRLNYEDAQLLRHLNAQAQATYTDPSAIDATCYDRRRNPGARSWFKGTAHDLLDLTQRYLGLLDRYSVPWAEMRTANPGRVIYEDDVQVVAVPLRFPEDWPFDVPQPRLEDAHEIVTLESRPDLVQTCAAWSFGQWGSQTPDGTLERTVARFQEAADPRQDFRHTFVVLRDGVPAAMASLSPTDLESRPDLAPWLASVYTHPEHRGHGLAKQLCGAVADQASALGHKAIYLFTPSAEQLYAQLGWQTIDTVQSPHGESALMCLILKAG